MDSPQPTELGLPSPTSYVADYFEGSPVKLIMLEGRWSLLEVVEKCNNASLPTAPWSAARLQTEKQQSPQNHLIPFFLLPLSFPNQDEATSRDSVPIGFLRPAVVTAMQEDNAKMQKIHSDQCWTFYGEPDVWAVSFADWFTDVESLSHSRDLRTEHMERMVRNWRGSGLFPELLSGWRDEKYTIYAPFEKTGTPIRNGQQSPLPGGNVAFLLERAATPLFSFATFGVHLTGYMVDPKTREYKFWIPRRSKTKQTFPYMFDNTVAGGITEFDSPLESIIRECQEEASLEADFVEHNLRSAGLISYVREQNGWLYPETEYTYDLLFPDEKRIPKPNDSEVDSFSLFTVKEVLDKMLAGEFKPNCALVMIDFFVRHGLVTYETDTSYMDICQQLRTRFNLPGPR